MKFWPSVSEGSLHRVRATQTIGTVSQLSSPELGNDLFFQLLKLFSRLGIADFLVKGPRLRETG